MSSTDQSKSAEPCPGCATVVVELRRLEAQASAKEVASKYIGKSAIPWIVLLVIVGVVASAFLPSESLPAVIGLLSTASMALIAMVTGIVSPKDPEPPKPEVGIISDLVARLDKRDPLAVKVDKDSVTVRKGDDSETTLARSQPPQG